MTHNTTEERFKEKFVAPDGTMLFDGTTELPKKILAFIEDEKKIARDEGALEDDDYYHKGIRQGASEVISKIKYKLGLKNEHSLSINDMEMMLLDYLESESEFYRNKQKRKEDTKKQDNNN